MDPISDSLAAAVLHRARGRLPRGRLPRGSSWWCAERNHLEMPPLSFLSCSEALNSDARTRCQPGLYLGSFHLNPGSEIHSSRAAALLFRAASPSRLEKAPADCGTGLPAKALALHSNTSGRLGFFSPLFCFKKLQTNKQTKI